MHPVRLVICRRAVVRAKGQEVAEKRAFGNKRPKKMCIKAVEEIRLVRLRSHRKGSSWIGIGRKKVEKETRFTVDLVPLFEGGFLFLKSFTGFKQFAMIKFIRFAG